MIFPQKAQMCHCGNMERRDVINTSLAFGWTEENGFSDLLGLCHSDFKLFIVMQDSVTFDQLNVQRCLVRMVELVRPVSA